jgi:hypothetical protein
MEYNTFVEYYLLLTKRGNRLVRVKARKFFIVVIQNNVISQILFYRR